MPIMWRHTCLICGYIRIPFLGADSLNFKCIMCTHLWFVCILYLIKYINYYISNNQSRFYCIVSVYVFGLYSATCMYVILVNYIHDRMSFWLNNIKNMQYSAYLSLDYVQRMMNKNYMFDVIKHVVFKIRRLFIIQVILIFII